MILAFIVTALWLVVSVPWIVLVFLVWRGERRSLIELRDHYRSMGLLNGWAGPSGRYWRHVWRSGQ